MRVIEKQPIHTASCFSINVAMDALYTIYLNVHIYGCCYDYIRLGTYEKQQE